MDYGATPEEIQAHFQACGTINRVTILCDKFTGHPKGCVLSWTGGLLPGGKSGSQREKSGADSSYAYVEFANPSIVANALVLDESQFRGRALSVSYRVFLKRRYGLGAYVQVKEKRTNVPGMNRGRGRGRGRGQRGYHPYRGGRSR